MSGGRKLHLQVLTTAMAFALLTHAASAQEAAAPQTFANWARLVEAGDVNGLVALFTDDVLWSSPDELISGKAAVRLRIIGLFAEYKATGSSFKAESVQASGVWGHVVASFTATWTARNGQKETERSRYLCALRREANGDWRIARFIFFPVS